MRSVQNLHSRFLTSFLPFFNKLRPQKLREKEIEKKMRPSICQSTASFVFKFLNYLHSFFGVFILLYSLWMLRDFHQRGGDQSSAPWFVYLVLCFGILMILISFIGYIAAVAMNGFFLSSYAALSSALIFLEAGFLADLVFNKHWEEDLPKDRSGELDILRAFIEANMEMFKWIAVTVVVIQALSLLGAMVLRGVVHSRSVDCDSDDDAAALRNPLLNPNGDLNSPSTVDITVIHSDSWRTRMRQKFGLVPSLPPNDVVVGSPTYAWGRSSLV